MACHRQSAGQPLCGVGNDQLVFYLCFGGSFRQAVDTFRWIGYRYYFSGWVV
ncbi:MAG: hypothetical protein LUD02_03660 [Tannerellaceae bacterium]|nr:hypothetical protein [Tannerellaceae bacterium]